MKKFWLSFFLVFSMVSTIVYAGNLVKKVYFSPYPILVDGEEHSSEMPILQYQERTYVPLREFSNMVGIEIDFVNDEIIIETNKKDEKNESGNEKYNENEEDKEKREEVEIEFVEKEEFEETNDNTASSISKVVYISKTGKKYHKSSNCSGANLSAVSLSEAIGNGYTPCLRCAK